MLFTLATGERISDTQTGLRGYPAAMLPWLRSVRGERYEYELNLLPKTMIELVVGDNVSDEVVRIIMQTARTGDIGDGRIFVLDIEEGHNIRTGLRDNL